MTDTLRQQVAEHLKFYGDLGVDGVSRDPTWRGRRTEPRRQNPTSEPDRSAEPVRQNHPAEPVRQNHPAEPVRQNHPVEPVRQNLSSESSGRTAHDLLVDIRNDIGDCTRCKLHRLGRRQIVFGVGNPNADLMFVGEAPGHDEDVQGIPFVGRAGQLLTKIIEAIGMKREDVYIANVLKCRPPENRNPEPDEVATCEPFLIRQIEAIRPKVIVALGTFGARTLLKTDMAISRLRGRVYDYHGAKLVATYHPAYLLRSPDKKRETWDDMKKVMSLLKDEG